VSAGEPLCQRTTLPAFQHTGMGRALPERGAATAGVAPQQSPTAAPTAALATELPAMAAPSTQTPPPATALSGEATPLLLVLKPRLPTQAPAVGQVLIGNQPGFASSPEPRGPSGAAGCFRACSQAQAWPWCEGCARQQCWNQSLLQCCAKNIPRRLAWLDRLQCNHESPTHKANLACNPHLLRSSRASPAVPAPPPGAAGPPTCASRPVPAAPPPPPTPPAATHGATTPGVPRL
jgi:hypothetical protein